MPCPINLLPLSLSKLLFARTQMKHFMAVAQNNVNAEGTIKVKLFKYLRSGGTDLVKECPYPTRCDNDPAAYLGSAALRAERQLLIGWWASSYLCSLTGQLCGVVAVGVQGGSL